MQRLRIALRRLRRCGLIGLHVAFGVLLAVPIGICGVFAPEYRDRLRTAIGRRWLGAALWLLGVRLELSGTDRSGGVLVVANHISWLDILVLGSLYGPSFVAKAEVAGWPVLGWLAEQGGTLFLQRGNRDSTGHVMERMTWRLLRGRTVLFFPEGTTTDGSDVRRFRARLFRAAVHAARPVQPVALQYRCAGGTAGPVPFLGEQGFVPNLWQLAGEKQIQAGVRRLDCLTPAAGDRALARQAETVIRQALRHGACESAVRQATAL